MSKKKSPESQDIIKAAKILAQGSDPIKILIGGSSPTSQQLIEDLKDIGLGALDVIAETDDHRDISEAIKKRDELILKKKQQFEKDIELIKLQILHIANVENTEDSDKIIITTKIDDVINHLTESFNEVIDLSDFFGQHQTLSHTKIEKFAINSIVNILAIVAIEGAKSAPGWGDDSDQKLIWTLYRSKIIADFKTLAESNEQVLFEKVIDDLQAFLMQVTYCQD